MIAPIANYFCEQSMNYTQVCKQAPTKLPLNQWPGCVWVVLDEIDFSHPRFAYRWVK